MIATTIAQTGQKNGKEMKKKMDRQGRYSTLMKVLGDEGLATVDESGVHMPDPVLHLGCVCVATFTAFRGGKLNPNMREIFETVGNQFGMSGNAVYDEIAQDLRDCNCWLPVPSVVWYLIGRWDALNENRIYFAKRSRPDSCRIDTGE